MEQGEYKLVLSLIRTTETLLQEKEIEVVVLKGKIKALKERLERLESGQLKLC